MGTNEWLAQRFEAERPRLRGVAYRMLGSLPEAEDAVQEAWLNVSRAGTDGVENLGGWLTTVLARVCLDMLRSRKARREDPIGDETPEPSAPRPATADPESEAVLADSVGIALLVILDTLGPAERLAFVLHDMFAMPFEEIATVLGRSPEATRQLASRARRRIQGAGTAPDPDLSRQREVVSAFLAAVRKGDFEGLVAVLDPDVHVQAGLHDIRGAKNWAKGAIAFGRSVRLAQPALVDGAVGLVLAKNGRLYRALKLGFAGDKIARVEVIADPARLAQLEIGLLEG